MFIAALLYIHGKTWLLLLHVVASYVFGSLRPGITRKFWSPHSEYLLLNNLFKRVKSTCFGLTSKVIMSIMSISVIFFLKYYFRNMRAPLSTCESKRGVKSLYPLNWNHVDLPGQDWTRPNLTYRWVKESSNHSSRPVLMSRGHLVCGVSVLTYTSPWSQQAVWVLSPRLPSGQHVGTASILIHAGGHDPRPASSSGYQ